MQQPVVSPRRRGGARAPALLAAPLRALSLPPALFDVLRFSNLIALHYPAPALHFCLLSALHRSPDVFKICACGSLPDA